MLHIKDEIAAVGEVDSGYDDVMAAGRTSGGTLPYTRHSLDPLANGLQRTKL